MKIEYSHIQELDEYTRSKLVGREISDNLKPILDDYSNSLLDARFYRKDPLNLKIAVFRYIEAAEEAKELGFMELSFSHRISACKIFNEVYAPLQGVERKFFKTQRNYTAKHLIRDIDNFMNS
jgi:hypothetical protein